ncbi:MAG: ComF family protein [Oscillospiraceae bacterium]|nr:ComF family protein [Oscillospiraceae bacterium]
MRVLNFLLDLLFPPRCVFCRGFLKKGEASPCERCIAELPFCAGRDVYSSGEAYTFCVSPLFYEDHVRLSHHRFKFQGFSWYDRAYGPLLADYVAIHCKDQYDLITWVPIGKKRLRKRGYDQGRLLAESTAEALGTRAHPTLQKVKNAAAMSGLGGREERRANISDAYGATDPALIAGKRVLLIDDVITTGSTLEESAQCLLRAGAKEVLCATLARAAV